MTNINIQFHAVPGEIIRFIKECAKECNLHIVMVELFPSFRANLLNQADDALESMPLCNTNRVCLYINKPKILSKNFEDFLDRNPDSLLITIGKYCDNALEGSQFATNTQSGESLKVWKKIVKEFKSETLSGAWVVNPYTGAKGFYKHHRYTKGAKKLFMDGVKIVPFVGWNYYVLSEGLV